MHLTEDTGFDNLTNLQPNQAIVVDKVDTSNRRYWIWQSNNMQPNQAIVVDKVDASNRGDHQHSEKQKNAHKDFFLKQNKHDKNAYTFAHRFNPL